MAGRGDGFRLLSLVEVWHGGAAVDLGRPGFGKVKRLLAVLLRMQGVPVATEALTRRVWAGARRGAPCATKYVSLLRAVLSAHGLLLTVQDDGAARPP